MLWDMSAGSLAVLGFWCSSIVGKYYHGYYGLTLEDLKLSAFLTFSWFVVVAVRLAGWPHVYQFARLWMWVALLVGLWTRYGLVIVESSGKTPSAIGLLLVVAAGFIAHRKASVVIWTGLRRIVALVPALIVASPFFLGQLFDENRVWLHSSTGKVPGKMATVVLLFDEMNANESAGLRRVLSDQGLRVNFKAVAPVNNSTSEVVPEIFTGIGFEGAQACGLSRICTDNTTLDFSKLSVGRGDVDVVGFHHPYCSIKGLRYCKRLTTSRSIYDEGRWACAFLRRFGMNVGIDHSKCQEISHRVWVRLQSDVVMALFEAPTLSRGGVLYAHLPLPHPPAAQAGSLAEQYRYNVKQSEQVLGRILDTLRSNNVEPRILIFSDHPLRQKNWCDREAAQFDSPCLTMPKLADKYVPVIVAARSDPPVIEHILSNREIFDILGVWLSR